MLGSTKALVLHKTNYSESSMVVQVFTREHGKVSLLVQGVKKKKARNKAALFEPLSILEIVADFGHPDKLIKPREIKLSKPLLNVQLDIGKRSIVLFLSEVIGRCVREPHPETALFDYIENSLLYLDLTPNSCSHFHLVFLMEMSRYLGFYPQMGEGRYFDINEGLFTNTVPLSRFYLMDKEKDLFLHILGTKIEGCHTIGFTSEERKQVLTSILKYYEVHISGWKEIKSHLILESVFI